MSTLPPIILEKGALYDSFGDFRLRFERHEKKKEVTVLHSDSQRLDYACKKMKNFNRLSDGEKVQCHFKIQLRENFLIAPISNVEYFDGIVITNINLTHSQECTNAILTKKLDERAGPTKKVLQPLVNECCAENIAINAETLASKIRYYFYFICN
jgi:hypothetical protein